MDKKKETKIEVWGVESGVKIYKTSTKPINYESSFDEKKMSKKDVDVPGAFVLTNVLTKKECEQFIDISEKFSYSEATITTFGGMVSAPDVRNNKRVMWQTDDSVYLPIYERIRELVPKVVRVRGEDWEVCGVNERLRFYRYDGGEIFKKHYDGCFPRNINEMSLLTFILYLNDGFEGGQTTFFVNSKKVKVEPETGSALLFFHGRHSASPLHEGSILKKGRKYVLRSDIMYRRKGTDTED